ncbi:unnamed protein product [marine sediment metagenome]|uniref:Uncharacterized protein n=1 Tax=marine sediment metagenome TaxID=412755 RepID=X0Z6D5_9ZZZZ
MKRTRQIPEIQEEQYQSVDLPFYRTEIAPILPCRVLDFHTHTWSADNRRNKPSESDAAGRKYMVTTEQYPAGELVHGIFWDNGMKILERVLRAIPKT